MPVQGTSHSETIASAHPGTGGAPPFRAPVAGGKVAAPEPLRLGQRFGDYEILRVLGTGSFAQVFLARQLSLDRLVALKVATDPSGEARTLASLEHAHIVQVFAEQIHREHGLRLLCMQYVPGLTLGQIIEELAKHDRAAWSGRLILHILDTRAPEQAVLDPVALEGRAFLQACDFSQAVCWLGARLAEALAHAHGQGVLHRDIKPANILLNRYGRPLLADFNIARAARQAGDGVEAVGGTLGYMAPEHLDAFTGNTVARVDERSDVYSLGVVLFELLTGQLPFPTLPAAGQPTEAVRLLAAERRGRPPGPSAANPDVPAPLNRLVRRCLAPLPEARYASAAEAAQALDGCRELSQVEQALPPAGYVTRTVQRWPGALLTLLILLPHFLGSAVNIPYNAIWIMGDLTTDQRVCFDRLVLGYNLIVYPLCGGVVWWLAGRLSRDWRRLHAEELAPAEVDALRLEALRLPGWVIALSCAGWLPGALLFPLGLHLFSDPVTGTEFGHFLVSFTISGLVALTYAYFGVQYVVLRAFYPHLWFDAAGLRRQARAELNGLAGRLRFFQILAGLIPLAGAVLMLTVGPEQFTLTPRLLVTGLIALGMLGFGVALLLSSRLTRVLTGFG